MRNALPGWERDPLLRQLETTVTGTGTDERGPWVALADTILYPEGGGQPADRGSVADVEVHDVQRVGGVVRHTLAEPLPPDAVGGGVVVELDWDRRLDHMQQHTAQHLVTAIAADRFGWQTTAFHLGARVSDVELDVPRLEPREVRALEEAVAAEVRAARPVTVQRVTIDAYEEMEVRSRGLPAGHEGDVRLVEIDGVDLNTCGGTHCASTAELEAVALLGTEAMRGGTKLFFVAGARLRARLAEEVDRTSALRTLLGASDDDIVESVTSRLEKQRDQARALRDLEEAYAVALAETLTARPDTFLREHVTGRGLPFLQRVAREVSERAPERVLLLTDGEGEEGCFLLLAGPESPVDAGTAGPRVAELLDGSGGGRGPIFQGRAGALSGRDAAWTLLTR